MKKQILILFLYTLAFNLGNAIPCSKKVEFFDGYEKATIHFLDGTSIKGYGKLVGFVAISSEKYKVKFKASKEGKADVWTDLMIKGVTFHYEFDDVTFLYVKFSKKSYPQLLQLVEEGAVNLYIKIESYWVTSGLNSKTGFPINNHKVEETFYYLKRKGADKVLSLTTGLNFEAIFSNFKKKLKKYFHDCDGIKNKSDSGNFNRTTIPEIVYYYNDFCGEIEKE
ncbi:hypothetical protein [uncultured Algibacter sp.]|uniref:hypothetical protein n=1 Tax=uncultured Algibacter sp. TaxID=298659 RepID=UPI00263609A6|nr:hypothetical protein [uncultured Algibacter sp.]